MAKQSTRDAALSRLFGNASEAPVEPGSAERAQSQQPRREASRRSRPGAERAPVEAASRAEEGGGEAKAPPPGPDPGQGASGYIGLGRYSRTDGIVERITPYVRPDQAEALRLAVARKNDPRGTDVSQIIQTLLDEAGYRS